MRPEDLTPTERRVWRAFATGARTELGRGRPGHEPERIVRATVIVALLRGEAAPEAAGSPGRVPAVRLRGARVTGRIDLAGADVRWLLSLYDCVLEEPPDFAHATTRTIKINSSRLPGFSAIWAHIGGHLTLTDSRLNGTVELTGARVGGELRLNAARIRPARGPGIDGGGLTVDGGCYGRGLRVSGGIRFPGGRFNGGVMLHGAVIDHPRGDALNLENAQITRLRCNRGFTSSGVVRLRAAHVAGQVSFRRATLSAPEVALHATRLVAEELDLRTAEPIRGALLLEHSRIGTLSDDPRTWPRAIRLNGMAYESIRYWSHPEDVKKRLDWLSRDPAGFRPQPYEELAAYYRRTGRDDLARAVLYAEERRRPRRRWGARVFGYLLDWTVGHGYKPQRAAYWLACLLTVGSVAFAIHNPAPVKADEAPHFNPVLYSLDLLSPIGGFGQREAFDPTGLWQWLAGLLVIAGWVLATALIAGVGRVYNRD